MSKDKLSKEEIRAPDAFLSLSERAAKVLEDHAGVFAGVVVAALVAGGGWTGWNAWQARAEKQAAAELYTFEAKVEATQFALREQREKQKDPKAEPPKEDFQALFAQDVSAWHHALKNYTQKRAGMISAMRLAGFLVIKEQFALAKEVLEPFSKNSNNSMVQGLLQAQLASVAIETQDWPRAASLYETLLSQKDLAFLHPQAKVRLALVLEKMGNLARARELLERTISEHLGSEASREAVGYLRLINLKHGTAASGESASPKG